MEPKLALAAATLFMTAAVCAAPEPLLGTWRLDSQEVDGRKTNSEPLTLRISQAGDKFAFAFSVPVNNVYFVSMSYTVKLDGSEAEVKNARGEKMGAVRITSAGPSQYNLILKGPNRPESSGKLTVSPDGKTLTSETDAAPSGPSGRPIHAKQIFSRE